MNTGATTSAEFHFDPTDPDTVTNPYAAYAWLRDHEPVHRLDDGTFVVTTDSLVREILMDHERFPAYSPVPSGEIAPLILATSNPPEHTTLRRAVAAYFRPRLAKEMSELVQEETDKALCALRSSGGGEVVETLSLAVPVAVISQMLGVSADVRERMRAWSDALMDVIAVTGFGMSRDRAGDSIRLVKEFFAYMRQFVAEKRTNLDLGREPSDIVERLLREPALSDVEVVSLAIFVLVAGHETTANTISAGILYLIQHPEVAHALRDDEQLLVPFIEEIIRTESPIQRTVRVAASDLELGGVAVPAGSKVLAYLGAANRDADVYDSPDDVSPANGHTGHLGFGTGIHYCLGAPLARVEATIVFSRWLRECADARIDPSRPPVWRRRPEPRGLAQLNVIL